MMVLLSFCMMKFHSVGQAFLRLIRVQYPSPLSLSFTDFLCPCVAVVPPAGRIAFDDGRGQTSSSP